MKLEPIKNPHSKTNQVQKKTKVEEKDDLIEKTKKQTIDKYGVKENVFNYVEKSCWEKIHADNCRDVWIWLECKIFNSWKFKFGEKDDFKLEEKVTPET